MTVQYFGHGGHPVARASARLAAAFVMAAVLVVLSGCSDGSYSFRYRLTVEVEDNGPGVPPEHRKTIFRRFHRAGGAEGGHGLGLALVGVIAARHGLRARVEDAGPGARFVVARQEVE